MRKILLLLWALAGTSLAWGADIYPSKPVRMISPFASGGTTDFTARLISQQLSEQLGKSFIVDNRTGASGVIGNGIVAKAPPDGYTLSISDPSFSIVPGLFKSLPYDPVRDFTAITLIMRVPNVLVVVPSLNTPALRDFIALMRANPGKYNYGSSGAGSSSHLAAELFKTAARFNTAHIAYKGGGDVISAMLAGEVHMWITTLPSVLTYVNSGRLRALAVATESRRVPSMPDVPAMGEAGVSGMEVYNWFGLMGPGGMPKDIVTKLHDEAVKALAVPSVKEKFIAQGGELVGSSPEELAAFIRNELRRWAAVIEAAGVKVE